MIHFDLNLKDFCWAQNIFCYCPTALLLLFHFSIYGHFFSSFAATFPILSVSTCRLVVDHVACYVHTSWICITLVWVFVNPRSATDAHHRHHIGLFSSRLPPQMASRLPAPSQLTASNGCSGFYSLPSCYFSNDAAVKHGDSELRRTLQPHPILPAQVSVLYTFFFLMFWRLVHVECEGYYVSITRTLLSLFTKSLDS